MPKKFTTPPPTYRIYFLLLLLLACSNVRIELYPSVPIPTATPWPTFPPLPTFTPRPMPTSTATPDLSCFLPDLAVGQHISAGGSYTEIEASASGRMVCHLERDSCAYHRLVGILDPTIVFKREEEPPYDTEDILMHPAVLRPLSRLNKLVLAEWDGAFQLRITDTYDSLLEHDPSQTETSRRYSLHYEGRAIDLTLWPIDRSRYGRLCALAHCAGFDWVHNEGTHCHASINADSLCSQCSE